MNRVDVSNRLLLAGLNNTEITTELALFDSLSASNQALYFDWMEEVSNADIATQVRSGNPARIPPTYTHDQEDNPTPSGASPLLRSLVVGTDPTTRAAGLLQMRWVTTTQPTGGLPQTNDEWQNPTTDTLQRWNGSAWSLVNRTAYNTTYMTLAAMAANPDLLTFGAITRDADGAALSAPVTWPDGLTGTYTGTASTAFPGTVDSYTITRVNGGVTTTYTQPTVTRDGSGAVTTRPALTVA